MKGGGGINSTDRSYKDVPIAYLHRKSAIGFITVVHDNIKPGTYKRVDITKAKLNVFEPTLTSFWSVT